MLVETLFFLFFFYFLQWLSEDFIGFLDKWEECVNERDGFTNKEKKLMILSAETRRGLRITGNHAKVIVKVVIIICVGLFCYSQVICWVGEVHFHCSWSRSIP